MEITRKRRVAGVSLRAEEYAAITEAARLRRDTVSAFIGRAALKEAARVVAAAEARRKGA